MNAEQPQHDREWYLGHVLADAGRFADCVRQGPPDADIEGCPGWDLRRLASHLGVVHRWAARSAATGAQPDADSDFRPSPDLDPDGLAAWLLVGAADLVDVLRAIDLEAPTWHPFPGPKIGRIWPRRQAHETAVHRVDAERAVGATTPIDPALASDGVDEYIDLMLRRAVERDLASAPAETLHLHCTDTSGEWLLSADDEGFHVVRAHEKGAAALRGPAEALLLRLWNRHTQADQLSPVGDEEVLAAWLALGSP